MEKMEGGDGEDGDGPRVKRIRQVYLPGAVVYNAQEAQLKRCDCREARSCRRRFRIPYEFFLELEAEKATKVVRIGCKGRGRKAVHTC